MKVIGFKIVVDVDLIFDNIGNEKVIKIEYSGK